MIFGVANAVGGSFTGPTWACGFTTWVLQVRLVLIVDMTVVYPAPAAQPRIAKLLGILHRIKPSVRHCHIFTPVMVAEISKTGRCSRDGWQTTGEVLCDGDHLDQFVLDNTALRR